MTDTESNLPRADAEKRVTRLSHASGMDDNHMPALRYRVLSRGKAKGGLALTMFGRSSSIVPLSSSAIIPH